MTSADGRHSEEYGTRFDSAGSRNRCRLRLRLGIVICAPTVTQTSHTLSAGLGRGMNTLYSFHSLDKIKHRIDICVHSKRLI